MLKELKESSISRVHFWVRSIMPLTKPAAISSAHVYLTYPFVLSWSMVEAMACGTSSRLGHTARLEVLKDSVNGLGGFFDSGKLSIASVRARATRSNAITPGCGSPGGGAAV